MRDWQPGRSLLGFLAVKTAQEGANVTGGQAVGMGIGALAGPEVAALSMPFLQVLAPYFKQHGIDLMKPYELRYGLSANDAREAQAVQQAQLGPTMAHLGGETRKNAHKLLGMMTQLTKGAIPGDMLKGLIDKMPDQALGMVVGTFAQADPQIAQALQTFMPGMVLNWDPLVQATRAVNGGQFDAQKHGQLLKWFTDAQKTGQFGRVPGQLALEAMPHALGPNGFGPNAPPQAITNLVTLAKEIQGRNLAPDFATSMQMATSMGNPQQTLINPAGALRQIDQLHLQMRKMQVPPEQMAKAFAITQMAKEKGLSSVALLQQMGAGGVAALKMTGGQQNVLTRAVERGGMEAAANMGNSTSIKALTALSRSSGAWGKSIDRMIASGDMAGLNKAIDQAKRDPRLWSDMRRVTPERAALTLARLEQNPGMIAGVVLGDAKRHARLLRDPALEQLLSRPAELQQRLKTDNFRGLGLKPKSLDLLQSAPFVGSVTSAYQTLQEAGYRGGGRLPRQKPFEAIKPLERLWSASADEPTAPVPAFEHVATPFSEAPTRAPTDEMQSLPTPPVAAAPVAPRPAPQPLDTTRVPAAPATAVTTATPRPAPKPLDVTYKPPAPVGG